MRGVLLRVAVIAVIAVGGFLLRDRLSGSATDLRVGDCFDVPQEEVISEVQHHPCDEAHDAEVFFVGDFPAGDGAPAPSVTEFETFVTDNCASPLVAYIGSLAAVEALDARNVDVGFMYPEPDGWVMGDHEVVCYLYEVDGGKLGTSLRIAS